MPMKNVKGTTYRSFRLGSNGIELISRDVLNPNGNLEKYRVIVKERGSNEEHSVIYDTDIPNSAIIKTQYVNNNTILKVYLKNGDVYDLPTIEHDFGYLKFIGSKATPNNVPLFKDEKGNIKDDGVAVSNTLTDNSTNLTDVVSVGAVKDYIGLFSEAMRNRLSGNSSEDLSND